MKQLGEELCYSTTVVLNKESKALRKLKMKKDANFLSIYINN